MTTKYRVQAKGNTRAELMIYGDIGDDWMAEESNDAKTVVNKLVEMNGNGVLTLDVRINSYGGVVADGLAIYNALRRWSGNVDTHIDGVAFSIASLIAMGGQRVNMADNALMMIHAPWGMSVGNAVDMRDMADTLDKFAEAMASAYQRDGGPSRDQIETWLGDGQDHYFSASEAADVGLADTVTEPIDIAAALRGASRYSIPAVYAAQQPETPTMAELQTPAAPKEPADPKTIVSQYNDAKKHGEELGAKAENKRIADIIALKQLPAFQAPQVQAVLDAALTDVHCDKNTARERAHAALEGLPQAQPIDTSSRPTNTGSPWGNVQPQPIASGGSQYPQGYTQFPGISGGDTRSGEGILAALMIKSGLENDRKVIAKERQGNEFLAMSLSDLMARELRAMGRHVGGQREDIVRAYLNVMPVMAGGPSHGTDHLPSVLGDIANKSAMQGFDEAMETWQQWTQSGTLNDYRPHTRTNIALLDKLSKMEENQEWDFGDMADVKQRITGYFYGLKYGLSIQAIVNDELGELSRTMMGWGEAGAATIGDAVFALLTTSGTGGYGQTMDEDSQIAFHADHGNYVASGAVPSEATVNTARAAMLAQTDTNSRTLAVRPRYLLHGPSLFTTVDKLISSAEHTEVTVDGATGATVTTGEANAVRRMNLVPVEEYRMTGATFAPAWMLAAARRTVEVSGVGGPVMPRADQSAISNTPGITYELSMPFGAALLDWRGMYLNMGD